MGLTLFGAPALTVDGEAVRFKRRKSVALTAYLALAERPQSRDRLASLLWPDTDTAHALASLRLALHDISSNTDLLATDGDLVSFHHDRCVVDVRDFQVAAGAISSAGAVVSDDPGTIRAMEAAVSLYTNEFLSGFSVDGSSEFDDWLFFTAESLQSQLGTLLGLLVEKLTPIDTTAAIRYAQQLVRLEPLDEDNHRALIDLYVTEGRFSAAIRRYEKCREILARELQEEPSSDLTDLYESLKGQADEVPEPTEKGSGYLRKMMDVLPDLSELFTSASGALRKSLGRVSYAAFLVAVVVVGTGLGVWHAQRPPRIPTIVVVPFSYFSVGQGGENSRSPVAGTLTRFIENALLEDSGLNVRCARTAESEQAGTDELIAIGRSESADFVLHGSVLDDGVDYVVTARLLDRWTGDLLLGQDFPATQADLGIELTLLAALVCESIYEKIGPEMTLYLKSGDALLNPYCETAGLLVDYHMQRTLTEIERAQLYSIIKEHLPVDPYVREGFFMQSDWYWSAFIYGIMPPDGAAELLRIAIESATEAEETPDLDIARGIYALMCTGDPAEAAGHFAASYRERPTSVSSARWWALSLAIFGQTEEALQILDTVAAYSPTDPSIRLYQATFRYLSGDYAGAIEAADRSIGINNVWIGLMQKGQALIMLDRLEEAVNSLEAAVAEQGTMQAPKAYLGYAYARQGRDREARSMRASARLVPNDDPSHTQSEALLAVISVGLNQIDRAKRELITAREAADPALWLLINDPVLSPAYDAVAEMLPAETVTLLDRP
ncbi:MAG: hypothetical protein KOO61_08720 [Spirochaetales bacterium]|nr:hypothetical protein [Spirochaetales bacterium]